ncbi:MAG TPA: LacI family DNA-binding transcriptional regulator [Ktedonobacterales bacterium]|nr:LacI family DNA-binding transcriptional regulator [Ktedonobacterales bacterium]
MRRPRITGRDVAVAAGVSHNTVSLVMRDSPLVKPETKEHVRKVIAELGYQRNAVAAALASSKSQTIGYLIPQDTVNAEIDVFRNQMLKAVELCAEAHDYYVLIDMFVDAQRARSLVSSGRIDALLVDARISHEVVEKLASSHIPIVLIGRDAGDLAISWVKADEEGGAYQATTHLIQGGHQRIAFITAGEADHQIVRQREQGYRRALTQAGLPIIPEYIVRGDWTFESSYELSSQLLRQNPRPTAFFVVTELMAAASLQAAAAMKLRVPRDIAVVTIGDSMWVRYVQPQLTAVHVPMMEVATQATELLFQHIEESISEPQQITVPTALIVRASSKTRKSRGAGMRTGQNG